MTIHQLALLVNDAQRRGDCAARETWDKVILSRLAPDLTRAIGESAAIAGLSCAIMDEASRDITLSAVDDIQAPYRVILDKPSNATVGYLLTLVAIDTLLFDAGMRRNIRIAGLNQPFESLDVAFTPWEAGTPTLEGPLTLKSPRSFVREYGDKRIAPRSVSPWLMRDVAWFAAEPAFVRWATIALRQCLLSLGDEIQLNPQLVIFKGPPRGNMSLPSSSFENSEQIFIAVQACTQWVYETPSETEMRHPLLAAEIARFATVDGTIALDAAMLKAALDGARLAYQLGMSKLSSDTLKMLTDLRKSVLDEATKVSDGTRQLVAGVATTLLVGIGMIAAKIGAHADGRIVGAISAIAVIYVITIAWSGYRFLSLQDEIRAQWKPRTYGFISPDSYALLVEGPAKKAANSYRAIARIGCLLSFLMLIVVLWAIMSSP
ncbi:hypothetical protein [Oleiagrimonas sp. C23AA]|uniref:hypothetical protein n=1 Tax=Oleiagrimonas sp. C23AA TaxID=2719047 RepID=UPI00141F5193|nr:hypothetical protein [Oleiagrimonas sp. C23AA]NII10984.1 hypothetical protein [Oleiagrimonas sp. C23AA]